MPRTPDASIRAQEAAAELRRVTLAGSTKPRGIKGTVGRVCNQTRRTQRRATQGGRGVENSFEIGLAIGMANEIEGSNIQRRQIIAVFLWALRRANNNHRNFGSMMFQEAHDVAVGAVNKPEATETGEKVLSGQRRPDLFNSRAPYRIDSIALQEFAHALAYLRVDRREQYIGSSRNRRAVCRILRFRSRSDRRSTWRNHRFCPFRSTKKVRSTLALSQRSLSASP